MINVTKTYLPNKEKYKAYIDRIYEAGWVTNNGVLVQELTERLEDYLGVRNLILVSNGTSALEVAYRVLGISGEAITTPFSFVATTSSLVSNGIKPVFADIDPHNFNISPSEILNTLTGRESAIVATHVFGTPCNINDIEKLAESNNLKVVFDAAHCFSTLYRNRSVLSYGDISTISFHATKLFHTIEGGAIVVNDDSLCEEAKYRINFGINGVDSVKSLGTNAKMNEFEAAMGLCVLDDIDLILEERAEIADYYTRKLSDAVLFQERNSDSNVNHAYFPVLFQNEEQCLSVKSALNNVGVYPRRYFYPSLDTLPYLDAGPEMRVSRDISKRIMTLPVYPGLSKEDQCLIVDTINRSCFE